MIMSQPVINVCSISKRYQLGSLGANSIKDGISEWFQKKILRKSIIQHEDNWGQQEHSKERALGKVIWALEDVSLKINSGETVGIIGRNGAGKSTLLKILSRVTLPTKGEIYLRGRTASLLEVGTGFHPDLTGRENIFLNGAILGMSKKSIQKHFDAIVDFSGVERFIDTPIKRYSSGMTLRLAFSVAAHLDAEIVIVDEVLAVGDAAFQKKCIDKMRQRSQEGRTVLFVSHQLAVLGALCPRAIWLEKGKVMDDGFSDKVLSAYLSTLSGKDAEKTWLMPNGNKTADLKAIRISQKGKIKDQLILGEDFEIQIDIEVKKDNSHITCYLVIVDKHENLLMHSAPLKSTSQGEAFNKLSSLKKGRYRFSCQIPDYLLTDGHYLVNVYITESLHQVITQSEREVSFTINDNPDWHNEYRGRWPGLIRPKLKWEIDKI